MRARAIMSTRYLLSFFADGFLRAHVLLRKQVERFGGRFVRNVGLGFKTPREAIEGTYIDKKCPFTGNVSIRGRILSGTVVSLKMQVCSTCVV